MKRKNIFIAVALCLTGSVLAQDAGDDATAIYSLESGRVWEDSVWGVVCHKAKGFRSELEEDSCQLSRFVFELHHAKRLRTYVDLINKRYAESKWANDSTYEGLTLRSYCLSFLQYAWTQDPTLERWDKGFRTESARVARKLYDMSQRIIVETGQVA